MAIKTKKLFTMLIFFTLSTLLITACTSGEPEIDIDAQRTGFAQTADSQATQTAQAIPTATNTPEPQPTATLTALPEITDTPEEEITVSETPGATPTTQISGGEDAAAWIAQDPPDNTEFTPGQEFTVTWSLENTGTSTWSENYYIQFASGEAMGAGEEKIYLPYPVPPNTNAQLTVNLIAPESTGEKRSDWILVNSSDVPFYEFYVIIDVVEGTVEE